MTTAMQRDWKLGKERNYLLNSLVKTLQRILDQRETDLLNINGKASTLVVMAPASKWKAFRSETKASCREVF